MTDKSFAYWHSATFNNDGTKVVFTDEWGGGTRPRCRATDLPNWGANAIFDIVDKKLVFKSYYKLPAAQTDTENCVAHNGSIVPVPGRDIMVQAWYQGGVSVFDFTDSSKPYEIAFFDRGPIDAKNLMTGGYWSTYWYNGQIYGAEMARGLDVLKLKPSEFLTQHEIDAATQLKFDTFNAQDQPKVVWPATPTVAKAYVDQLTRSKGFDAAKAQAVNAAIDKKDKGALGTLAASIESDAAAASGSRCGAHEGAGGDAEVAQLNPRPRPSPLPLSPSGERGLSFFAPSRKGFRFPSPSIRFPARFVVSSPRKFGGCDGSATVQLMREPADYHASLRATARQA